MASAGIPTGPAVPTWTPPPSALDRLSLVRVVLKQDPTTGYPAKPDDATYAEFVGWTDPSTLGLADDYDIWIPVAAP
jgi:hypothetical protein